MTKFKKLTNALPTSFRTVRTMPIEINPNLTSNQYCDLKPLRNGLGFPIDGSTDLYDGALAEDEDVISWSNAAGGALGDLHKTRDEILKLAETFGPASALEEFLDGAELLTNEFNKLREEGYVVYNPEEYDARSPATTTDSTIVKTVHDLAQRIHCLSGVDGTNLLYYYEGLAAGSTEDNEPAHGQVSTTPQTGGGGFPWWILLVAAGGYGYYRYKQGK